MDSFLDSVTLPKGDGSPENGCGPFVDFISWGLITGAALLRRGWSIKRESGGSHKVLECKGWPDYVWAFHDGAEIGPVMLSRIAKKTGLTPEDL